MGDRVRGRGGGGGSSRGEVGRRLVQQGEPGGVDVEYVHRHFPRIVTTQ